MWYVVAVIVGGVIAVVMLGRHWRKVDDEEQERRAWEEAMAQKYPATLTQDQADWYNTTRWDD